MLPLQSRVFIYFRSRHFIFPSSPVHRHRLHHHYRRGRSRFPRERGIAAAPRRRRPSVPHFGFPLQRYPGHGVNRRDGWAAAATDSACVINRVHLADFAPIYTITMRTLYHIYDEQHVVAAMGFPQWRGAPRK